MSGFDLSSFLASFFDEARGRLANINQNLVRFESGDLDEDGLIETRRDAHTIKGSALMLGVKDVGDCAHLFEDAMAWLIEHPERRTPAMIQFLFDLHDALQARVEDYESSPEIEVAPLRDRFERLKTGEEEGVSRAAAQDAGAPEESAGEAMAAPAGGGDADDEDAVDLDEMADIALASLAEELGGGALADEQDMRGMEAAPLPDASQAIGADEAEAWKARRERERQAQQETPAAAQAAVSASGEMEPAAVEVSSADEGDEASGDAFRPRVESMQRSARRAGSGRFVRVDAGRIEMLSNQVVELSTEKAWSENLEDMLGRMHVDFRMLNRSWRNFMQYGDTWPEEERERAMSALVESFDRQMRWMKRVREELRYGHERHARILDDLRDQVLGLMVRPIDQVFSTFPRAVRDAAARHGKKVRLLIGGESVEMDQAVGDALAEPLVHLLNNAVAHGIEPPEERLRLGKPEEGQVTILTRHAGGEIHIDVIDDGRGIDVEKVRARAVELGVTTQAEADEMDSAEVLEMIFRPGFSTAKEVSDIAGRGIGMNIVQDTVRKLTGTIRIHTEPGKGTRFSLQLPVSIAVQKAMLFRIGGQRFGMLTHMVEQALPLREMEVGQGAGNKRFVRYGRHQAPLVDLRHLLGGDAAKEGVSSNPYVLIAEHIEGYVGILVDELFDETEIIVRDLDPYLKRYQTQGLMGNTILGDGSVLLLIEPYGIKEMGRTAPDIELAEIGAEPMQEEAKGRRVLLVEDSIIAREVEKSMLEAAGFEVGTAIDGLDALERLALAPADLVITDLEMPRLDGFGLVRRLRNDPRYEEIPILVISTRESPEDRMRATEAGADAYLVKQQLTPEGLREHLRRLLGGERREEAGD